MDLYISHLVDLVHVVQRYDSRGECPKRAARFAFRLDRLIVYKDFSFHCLHFTVPYLPRGPPPPPPNGLGWKGFCELLAFLLFGISLCPMTIMSPSLMSRPEISVTLPLVIPTRTNLTSSFLSGPRTYIICPCRRCWPPPPGPPAGPEPACVPLDAAGDPPGLGAPPPLGRFAGFDHPAFFDPPVPLVPLKSWPPPALPVGGPPPGPWPSCWRCPCLSPGSPGEPWPSWG